MGFPELDRFTIEAVAKRWGELPSYVEEMVRTRQFKHIIVEGEMIGGSPLTRHIYFDRDLFKQHHPEQPVGLTEKEKERLIAQIRSLMAEQPDRTPDKVFEKEAERRIDRIQKDVHEERPYRFIGPNEVANLWQPFDPSKPRERPKEAVANRPPVPPEKKPDQARKPKGSDLWKQPLGTTIFIPKTAVKAFERKYGTPENANAQQAKKQEKEPPPDLSKLVLDEWYPVHRAARWMSMHPEYLRGDLIPNGKLKAQKRGKRAFVQGHEIMRYLNQYATPS